MGTRSILQIIELAREHEAQSGALREQLATDLPRLQTRLSLPEKAPLEALLNFVERYIDHVPDFLDSIDTQAHDAGTRRLLHMAEDYFLAPPDALNGEEGLRALLDEAFLAHRFIEELNDRHCALRGKPLLEMDMTRANIIAHFLIGEPMATRLETLVSRSVDLAPLEAFRADGPEACVVLPCMSRDAGVDLKLADGRGQSPLSEEGRDAG